MAASKYSTEEIKSLLSTLDGCTIDCKINGKDIFDSDNLVILFAKDDALYIEDINPLTKEPESTRLILFYENIETLSLDDNCLSMSTKNMTRFEFILKKAAA